MQLPAWLIERRFLLALLFIAAALWGFVHLADGVSEGEGAWLDTRIMLLLREPGDPARPLGGERAEGVVRDVTALGGWTLATLITAAIVGWLLLAGRGRQALFVAVAVLGAALLAQALKGVVERPRPDLVPHGVAVFTYSFPSGHATHAAATYLTLSALLARFQPRRRLKIYTIALGVLVTLAVGLSRIYLGVHWPSDVLAGWTLGSCWATVCWSVAYFLQRRGRVEPSDQPVPETG